MRRILVAGNWKMNLTLAEARALAAAVADLAGDLDSRVDVAVFPPDPYLVPVADALTRSKASFGGQDMHWEPSGAFTGAVSGPMLAGLGCTRVLVGHSERRHVFGETDDDTNRKVQAALNHGLRPILCVGEQLDDREASRTEAVLARQLASGLAGLSTDDLGRVVLAYEPVWAIGTGRTATPEMAQEAHAFLRGQIREQHGDDPADRLQILYGGSVKPDNTAALMGQPDLDGVLVGGASLKADSFAAIARESQPVS